MSRFGVGITFCHTCLAEYMFYRDGHLSHYSLYTTIGDRMYRWTQIKMYGYLRYVAEPGVPGVSPNKGMQMIKSFTVDVPDITPTNINEKLRTYLVFL
jgi:hypothetical protein